MEYVTWILLGVVLAIFFEWHEALILLIILYLVLH